MCRFDCGVKSWWRLMLDGRCLRRKKMIWEQAVEENRAYQQMGRPERWQ